MSKNVLILGGSGRFGRNATKSFLDAGWNVRQFNRETDDLTKAAIGIDVIVNAMNPSYEKWRTEVPKQTAQVIAAAKASGATVIIPGNVYVFGADAPARLTSNTTHAAKNPLGRVRIEMEAAYRASGVQVIVLRAGDFIDTLPSGNWFDRVLTAKLSKGIFTYMARADAPHAWAYLPDVTRAAVDLAEQRTHLNQFEDVPFSGYTLTAEELETALEDVTGRNLRRKVFSYLPLILLAPFWKMGRHLVEMRYLWSKPHFLDDARLKELLPDFKPTPLREALKTAL